MVEFEYISSVDMNGLDNNTTNRFLENHAWCNQMLVSKRDVKFITFNYRYTNPDMKISLYAVV